MKIKLSQFLLLSFLWVLAFPAIGIGQSWSGKENLFTENEDSVTESDCMADFFYTNIPDPSLTVLFINNSFPLESTWFWDFGDGNTSTEMNPEHVYENPGNYTVCLSIEDSLTGCTDMNCQEIFVFPSEDCLAAFDYFTAPSDPFTVYFYDLSFGNIDSWNWEFGDGTTSLEINPVHTYNTPGSYEVCLTVSDLLGGCADTYCGLVIVDSSLSCNAYFEYFEMPPGSVQFIDNSQGFYNSWFWEFGDGTTSREQFPVHSYEVSGFYDVCLTISDNAGFCDDTYCEQIYIDMTLPDCFADFTYAADTSNYFEIHFSDNSIGEIIEWNWEFDDGSFSSEQNPVHTFMEEGIYNVCLTVSDGNSCEDEICYYIVIAAQSNCEADFDYYIQPQNLFTVEFTDFSTGNIELWYWDFGDGSFSFDQNPVHQFPFYGTYNVCLIVGDYLGNCQSVMCRPVNLYEDPICQADFTYAISNENPFEVEFIDQSTGSIAFWSWDFGDGGVSSAQNPSYEYAQEGTYNVCLVVANNQGTCVSVYCDSLTIQYPDSCVADFDYQILDEEFLSVQFTDLSEGDISQWLWDFGDGTTSVEQHPVHEYGEEGTYNVCLEVLGASRSCSSIFCDQLTLEIPEYCEADFTHEVLENQILTVQFTALSQGIPNQRLWDFGDGNFSDLQNPLHIYADTGSYTVQLIISNTDSLAWCSDTISKIVDVQVQMPECLANFTMHPDSGVNVPNLYHFYDASENSPEAWLWDFGDGQTSLAKNPTHQYETSGNYEVSLTVTKYNPWGEDCSDTKTIAMQTPAYFHIGGFIYAGNFPINNPEPTGDTAIVYLYRYHDNKHVENIDTSVVVENGYFHALFLLEDSYMIKFRLTDGSTNAATYFPTYFGDEVKWLDAPVLSLADSSHYSVNVHLTEIPERETGIGIIAGSVMHHSNADTQVPAGDSEILIYNSSGQAIGYVHSSEDGEFGFENLAFGTYTLYAESTGLFTDPITVTLSEANPAQFDVEIELFNTDITSVADLNNNTVTHFRVFPNPVYDILNLSFNEKIDKELTYRIYDYSGREIIGAEINSNIGSSGNEKIDVSRLAKGIYFIHVYSMDREFSETLKFVR